MRPSFCSPLHVLLIGTLEAKGPWSTCRHPCHAASTLEPWWGAQGSCFLPAKPHLLRSQNFGGASLVVSNSKGLAMGGGHARTLPRDAPWHLTWLSFWLLSLSAWKPSQGPFLRNWTWRRKVRMCHFRNTDGTCLIFKLLETQRWEWTEKRSEDKQGWPRNMEHGKSWSVWYSVLSSLCCCSADCPSPTSLKTSVKF